MSLELVRYKMVNDPVSPFASNEVEDEAKKGEKATGVDVEDSPDVKSVAAPAPPRTSLFGASLANDSARSIFQSSCTCSSYIIALSLWSY